MKKVLSIINNIIFILLNVFFAVFILDDFEVYLFNYTFLIRIIEFIFAYPIIYLLPIGLFMILKVIQMIRKDNIIFDKKYNIIMLLFNISLIPIIIEYYFNTGFSISTNFYLYVLIINILIIIYNLLSIKTLKKESL